MSTRRARILPGLCAVTAAFSTLWACGTGPGVHYQGQKSYGANGQGGADAAPDPVIPAASLPQPTPAVTLPVVTSPSPVTPAAPAPPAAAAPALPPSPVSPGVNNDPQPDAPPALPPGTLLKNERYGSVFDSASAQGISDKSGYRSLGPLAGPKVRANLVTQATDGLTIAQTFGDGISRSLVTQGLVNSAADLNRKPGMPTTSGERRLDRVTSAACPGVFLCIDRMVVTPTTGDPRTVCFADAATGKPLPFPYGALPNYHAADFTAFLGAYGPYAVTAYPGSNVACASPGVSALATETVQVAVTAVDVSALKLQVETIQPLAPQFAIALTNSRVQGDLLSPYIDETVALDGAKTFVMNADAAEMTALIVTSRQSISIAAQEGGGILGGLAGVLIGLDGVVVDLHFELCLNLLDAKAVDRCAAPAAP